MSTGISWTDETWNPTTGCSKVSEGCRHCYAAALAPRLAAMGQTHAYTDLPWTKPNAAENVKLHPDRLEMPLRWKKPRRIFVNSMSDLFHELVPFEFVDKVFAVMALAPQHTFQVLTKRPERMAEYTSQRETPLRCLAEQVVMKADAAIVGETVSIPWPLPNVWLGSSVEDQRAADERIPHLLRTPAAVRFLSCEPLIGPVKLYDFIMLTHNNEWGTEVSEERGWGYDGYSGGFVGPGTTDSVYDPQCGIHWVIAGGESGPGHRHMQDDWARSLRDQCVAAGVPFFFKQHSGHRNEMDPYLDGREWREMPAVAS